MTCVAKGRHGIAPLLHEVERVAKYLTGQHSATLERATDAMRTLVNAFANWAMVDTGLRGMCWNRLYSEVKHARNDIACWRERGRQRWRRC